MGRWSYRAADDPAARALALGVLVNGGLKLVLAVVLGEPRFARLAGASLAALVVASALALLLLL